MHSHQRSISGFSHRRPLAAALAVATCLVLGACGSDSTTAGSSSPSAATQPPASSSDTSGTSEPSDSSTSSSAATQPSDTSPGTSAAAVPSGPPVKVLLIRDGEGTPVNIPQISDAANAAANAINAAGGIQGRPLQVDECNSKLDPNAAADCARQGTSGDYAAIVGTLTSNDGSIVPIAESADVPLVGIIPTTQASYGSPDSFPISGGSSVRAIAMAKAVTAAGAKKVSILYIDVAAAAAFVPVLEGGVTSNGATLGKSVGVPAGTPDMSSYVANALSDDVDGVILFTTAPDAVKMVQAIRNSGGENVHIAFAVSNADDLVQALGADADGLITATPNRQTSETTYPGVKQYVDEMEASNFSPANNEYAINAWASVHLFAQVASTLTDITPQTVKTAMETATYDNGGLTPPIDFAAPVTNLAISAGAPRIFTSELEFVVVEDGALTPTTGDFTDVAG
jgi:branched-chain amino acid transport system substrate-binding protein